jgi:rhodanese-related sulfurtransferase
MKFLRLAFLGSMLLGITAHAADAPKIAAKDASRLVTEGKAVLVDCREAPEWQETGVAAPAELLAKSSFDADHPEWKEFLAKNKGKQIIVYCRTGRRSASVANALAAQGVNASNVGGLKDWTDAGLPTRSVGAPKAPPTDPSKK